MQSSNRFTGTSYLSKGLSMNIVVGEKWKDRLEDLQLDLDSL